MHWYCMYTKSFLQWISQLIFFSGLCHYYVHLFPLTFPDHCFNFSPKIFTFIIFILSQFCHFITLILQSNLSFLLNNSFTQMFHHISWWFFFFLVKMCYALFMQLFECINIFCFFSSLCLSTVQLSSTLWIYVRTYVCVCVYVYLLN